MPEAVVVGFAASPRKPARPSFMKRKESFSERMLVNEESDPATQAELRDIGVAFPISEEDQCPSIAAEPERSTLPEHATGALPTKLG